MQVEHPTSLDTFGLSFYLLISVQRMNSKINVLLELIDERIDELVRKTIKLFKGEVASLPECYCTFGA